MKPTQNKIMAALGLLVIAGMLLTATSCGPEKHKIDDTTVPPFKDKADLDKLLNLSILPDYTIEEYYTRKDFATGDEQFVVYCKFIEKVSPEKVKEIAAQVNNEEEYHGWFIMNFSVLDDKMRLCFDLDTTFTAGQKRPEMLGDHIHVSVELPCEGKDSWKGFEVVFRNNRADFSAVVNRETLSKLLGVEFPPLTETGRSDENIYFEFDSIPSEEFCKAVEKAPHWTFTHRGDYTMYSYDYDNGEEWITADFITGHTHFSFTRNKSMK